MTKGLRSGKDVGGMARITNHIALERQGWVVEELTRKGGRGGPLLLSTRTGEKDVLWMPFNRFISGNESLSMHMSDRWSKIILEAAEINAEPAVIFNVALGDREDSHKDAVFNGMASVYLRKSELEELSLISDSPISRTPNAFRLHLADPSWASNLPAGSVEFWRNEN